MATSLGNMVIHMGIDTHGLESGAKGAVGQLNGLQGSVAGMSGKLPGFASGISSAAAALTAAAAGAAAFAAAAAGAGAAASWGLQLAASAEESEVAFKVMLGSAEKAQQLLDELGEFAAKTPFEFPELEASARKLLAFGVGADQMTDTLTMLGDISAGVGAPLGEIAELFGKMKVQGTLYAEDINQLVGRGIPVIQEFAKQLGVSEGEVKKLASQGKITFANLEEAFRSLTGEGSKFGGLMEERGKTLNGMWSTIWDTLKKIGKELGKALLPSAKVVTESIQRLAEKFGELITANLPLIENLAERVAIMLVDIIDELVVAVEMFVRWATWLTEIAEEWGVIEKVAKKAVKAGEDATNIGDDIAEGMKEAQAAAADFNDLLAKGKSLTESLRLPDEVFNDSIAEIKELYEAGAISLETVSRAVRKAQDDLESATKQAQENSSIKVGAAERFTAEGFSAVQDGRREMAALVRAAEKAETQRNEHKALLTQIRDGAKPPPIKMVSL